MAELSSIPDSPNESTLMLEPLEAAVVTAIRRRGPLSRSDLSEQLAYSRASVTGIVGRMIDVARREAHSTGYALVQGDLNAVVGACVERYVRAGKPVGFHAGAVPWIPMKPTALSRLVANLVDNALAYGAPPVDVTTSVLSGMACSIFSMSEPPLESDRNDLSRKARAAICRSLPVLSSRYRLTRLTMRSRAFSRSVRKCAVPK